jgi:hypothetical protein
MGHRGFKDTQNFVGKIPVRSGGREWLLIPLQNIQPFLHDLAEFSIDLGFIIAMTARPDQTRTLADKALIVLRPLDNF